MTGSSMCPDEVTLPDMASTTATESTDMSNSSMLAYPTAVRSFAGITKKCSSEVGRARCPVAVDRNALQRSCSEGLTRC